MPHKNKDAAREYFKKYHEDNKEKISSYHKNRYQMKKEEMKDKARKYHHANKEKVSQRAKIYREDRKDELALKAKGYRAKNREFLSQKDREEYKTPKVRNAILLRSFGITLDQYNAMNEAQGGLCAICNRPQVKSMSRLSVDHCHETGKIRGLLCTRCNTGIGMLNDSIEYVESALLYLISHKNVLTNGL